MGLKENASVKKYINSVCAHIRNYRVHEAIKTELLTHIEEIVSEYLYQGMAENKAIDKALIQMGDAKLVGKELNKIHKLTPEGSILFLTTLFASMGLLIMYIIENRGVLPYNLSVFKRSLFFTIIGLSVALTMYFVEYNKIKAYSKHIYLGSLLILFYTGNWGAHLNSTRGFLTIGPLRMNFVGVSPFLFIIALAGLLDNWNWKEYKQILYGLVLCLAPAVLMLMCSSYFAFITYGIAVFVLMIVSRVPSMYIIFMVMGFGLPLFAGLNSYNISRILTFINPIKDPRGMGWIYVQLNEIIDSAGLYGQGFDLNATALPEIHTDFIFAYIVYTFGWMAGIVLAALVITFLIRMARTAMIVKDKYGKLLISGIVSIFAVQFLWSILMNLGLAPITGASLPFISYGGSQSVVGMAAVGLILNVYKWRNMIGAYKML